jgi:hypothetical protein
MEDSASNVLRAWSAIRPQFSWTLAGLRLEFIP